jgi:cytochrome c oxidase subunit II
MNAVVEWFKNFSSSLMGTMIGSSSTYAGDIDAIIVLVAILAGFWFIVAEVVLIWLVIKFRRSKNPKASYITGEEKHEKRWIQIPHNLILVCDVAIIAVAIGVWYKVKQDLPPADETVRIVAQQWGWHFTHPGPDKQLGTPDDIETTDELHIKVDTTYHYKLESLDVLHSFSVPVFRLKQDAIPGREITGWFKPTKTGVHDIQCAEICGIGHGLMPARIHIESEQDHAAWVTQNAPKNG